jgi:hypothetical protein
MHKKFQNRPKNVFFGPILRLNIDFLQICTIVKVAIPHFFIPWGPGMGKMAKPQSQLHKKYFGGLVHLPWIGYIFK